MGIFGGKKENEELLAQKADMALLLEYMKGYTEGNFARAKEEEFSDPEPARVYNALVDKIMDTSNRMLMRLNDAMYRIGDSELIKDMLEEVGEQTGSIDEMENRSSELDSSISNISSSAVDIRESSHVIIQSSKSCMDNMKESTRLVDESVAAIGSIQKEMDSFRVKAKKINAIIDQVRDLAEDSSLLGLNASIEAARAGEAGRGFAVVAEQVNQLSRNTADCAADVVVNVGELMEGIDSLDKQIDSAMESLGKGNEGVHSSIEMIGSMNDRLGSIDQDINNINDEIDNQSRVTKAFIEGIHRITDGYRTLSEDCQNIGERFYRISRDIDSARSFEFRSNSKPTLIDSLKVFAIDHLIFTWRVYNHIAGFEKLKITQLNNPKGCKIGKWFAAQTDPVLTGSVNYKNAYELHDRLHSYAVEAFNACESGNRQEAMTHFYEALEAYEGFESSMQKLMEEMRRKGNKETPVWVFNPQP